jgi:hypothetical protein
VEDTLYPGIGDTLGPAIEDILNPAFGIHMEGTLGTGK